MDANYKIEGDAFTVTEGHAAARTILGYPIAEIQRLIRESPATPWKVPPMRTTLASG